MLKIHLTYPQGYSLIDSFIHDPITKDFGSHRHGKTGIKVFRVDATILMRNLGLLPVGILFLIWWW